MTQVETITSTKTQLEKVVNDKNYYNKKNRLESLKKCPKISILQPSYEEDEDLLDDLATGGFYYNDFDKTLRCFCCDISIELKSGENPTAKHWLLNTDCNFLKSSRYNGPKMIEHVDPKSRMQSFGLWPSAMVQRPRDMAEAGFTYTGEGDRVQCFYCFGRFSKWEEFDDPWEEHAYWVPTCQYVIIKKGIDYIKKVEIEGRKGNGRRRKDIVKINKPSHVEEIETGENSSDKCAMCWDRDRNICFVPCNHFASCSVCSFNTPNCPVCRTTIQFRIPRYVC